MKTHYTALLFLALSPWGAGVQGAAPLPEGTSFQMIGIIESFKLDPTLCPGAPAELQGARMKVNGIDVIIPCNTIITMPAAYLTPQDIFRGPHLDPAAPVSPQSGLALVDTPPPLASFEATIDGNIVAGQHRAGLVHISQQALNNGSGFITAIDRSTGILRVGSGQTPDPVRDARVRLNDPAGRYGMKTLASDPQFPTDERFTSDDQNPTVHAETGFPMCVPRAGSAADDPLCPRSNRPTDPAATTFVMGSALANFPAAVPCPGCNPKVAAPLLEGDYINYSGTLAKDASGTTYISAHTVAAAVGIFTQPGQKPVYVSQEVSLIGTGGAAFTNPNIDQEISARDIKVVGFTTDPSQPVDIFALQVDPCTGDESEVLVATARPGDVPFGRFRVDIHRAQSPVPIPLAREFRVKARQGVQQTDNGLEAGQYTAPVSEYIFPENRVFGDPLIPLNLQDFSFLGQGSGPLCTLDRIGSDGKCTGPRVGQLVPWPGAGARIPIAAVCP